MYLKILELIYVFWQCDTQKWGKTKNLFISKHMHLSPACFMSVSLSLFLSLADIVYVVLPVHRKQAYFNQNYILNFAPKKPNWEPEQHQNKTLL